MYLGNKDRKKASKNVLSIFFRRLFVLKDFEPNCNSSNDNNNNRLLLNNPEL